MKNQEFLSEEYPKKCECCENLKSKEGEIPLVCRIRGEVKPEGFCRRFVFDPLRKKPNIGFNIKKFTKKDFEL